MPLYPPKPTYALEKHVLENNLSAVEAFIANEPASPNKNEAMGMAFFRALESQNTDIALRLLKEKGTQDILASLKVESIRTIQSLKAGEHVAWTYRDYLSCLFSEKSSTGLSGQKENVALLFATKYGDEKILTELMRIGKIKKQREASAIAMLLMVTQKSDGSFKTPDEMNEWQDLLVSRLLDYPLTLAYASSRWFDFAPIVSDYQNAVMTGLKTKATAEYFNALSSDDSRQFIVFLENIIEHRLIECNDKNLKDPMGDIHFLFGLKPVQDVAHQYFPDEAAKFLPDEDQQENYLLKKVIEGLDSKKNNPNNKVVREKLMLVAGLLIERCPNVRRVAEAHHFYGHRELQTKFHRPIVSPLSLLAASPATTQADDTVPNSGQNTPVPPSFSPKKY